MNIGNKILELRKKNNLSQEQLAEKIDVTRQTISKWELGETSPDIRQAKELSRIFNVSLDELVNNEVKDILVEKISNTEKLAGIIIKLLKIGGIIFLIILVIDIISLILFSFIKKDVVSSHVEEVTIDCSINDNDYLITVATDAYFNCSNCSKDIQNEINEIIDYSDINKTVKNIENYFINKNGICE